MVYKKVRLLQYFTALTLLLLLTFFANAQIFEGIRIGGGLGGSIYWGSQMDYKISLNTYGRSEINKGYNFQIYKSIGDKHEIGFRYLTTQLWSFKSDDRYAANTKLEEFAIMYQKSLNNNIGLHNSNFTYNMVYGVGIINYSSQYYLVDKSGGVRTFFSIGNGSNQSVLKDGLNIAEKRPTVCGIIGFNIGYRLAKHVSVYVENTFTLSGSNYISGNLYLRSNIPNNGYTYHAISLFINVFGKPNPLSCPKF